MAESLLVGRNFVSGICKIKPFKIFKNLKPFLYKKTMFYQPCFVHQSVLFKVQNVRENHLLEPIRIRGQRIFTK